MKQLCLLALLVMSLFLLGADPNIYMIWDEVGSTTVDSQFSASLWDSLGQVIVVPGDTCVYQVTVSGVALMGERDVLYFAWSSDTALGGMELDTIRIQPRYKTTTAISRIPFSHSWAYIDTTVGTDTIYLYGAVGGSSDVEKVQLEDCWIVVNITNNE